MDRKKQKKFLIVPPFKCTWQKELRFKEAGRGCVAFEASAHNDVTLVFRERVGSQHYHYRTDITPNYTIILGSHRNRRLKIEVNGKTVVDETGVGLCCSLTFQSYWISIYDGLISIGKGRYPFQNLVFQWLDSNPNRSVQYIGLSSWDKHVGYRNINVLPSKSNHILLWNQLDHGELECGEDEDIADGFIDEFESEDEWGLKCFLENWDLSDVLFIVGDEEKAVPAHKVIMGASGNFCFSSSNPDVIQLPGVTYPIFHAFLQYIYTGQAQILEEQLGALRDLSLQFEVMPLVKQCEEITDRFKLNKKLFDSGRKVEISHPCSLPQRCTVFPFEFPIDVQRLKQCLSTGEFSDVEIYIDGHGLVACSHKLILSLWSAAFTKMFTIGMYESNSSKICLRDTSVDAFVEMLQSMYSGELGVQDAADTGSLLLQILLLADQFGVTLLLQGCCKTILECLSEDTVCSILQVISSIPSCKSLEEACERKFSKHFDYCTKVNTDFVFLDEVSISNILECPNLNGNGEKILDAILLWGMEASDLLGWEAVDTILKTSTPDLLFGERLQSVNMLLPLVRFPLMPITLLKKLEKCNLSIQMPVFEELVMEAIKYSVSKVTQSGSNQNVRFQHRQSTFKEFQYISDGDNNGVLYFAGTSYGKHQWVNPVLSMKITVTASNPASRFTDPKALVSRTYQGTSFAGPRIEDGKNCSWWMVEIGEDHQLMCNYYTLRQDGSSAFMRSWALQGSLDEKNWTNLSVHENDQTICKPGQYVSWPVNGPTALFPFRFFRVVLTGPTTSDSGPWNLCICFLELYGYFHM